jgi:hypothetical protein
MVVALILIFSTGVVHADDPLHYQVTIQNLTQGQPLSPPVAATHQGGILMFRVGDLASSELEAIAEDGNEVPMFNLFDGSDEVTEAVDIGVPLTPNGTVVGSFTDSATFDIMAQPGDKLSLATMLICTNDGFTGVDRGRLPKKGSSIFLTAGYDAGTENNTENSEDIVDPCTALGPVSLSGDPDGNEDAAVETTPHQSIQHHPNIAGMGELTVADHGWTDPVTKVTVVLVSDDADRFEAPLSGAGEVPPVDTGATGRATFSLNDDETELRFKVKVRKITGVTAAHIHCGAPNVNGPVVAFLFGPVAPTGTINGTLAKGTLTNADVIPRPDSAECPGGVANLADLIEKMRSGDTYVNAHTAAHPGGEMRGQIGADD